MDQFAQLQDLHRSGTPAAVDKPPLDGLDRGPWKEPLNLGRDGRVRCVWIVSQLRLSAIHSNLPPELPPHDRLVGRRNRCTSNASVSVVKVRTARPLPVGSKR